MRLETCRLSVHLHTKRSLFFGRISSMSSCAARPNRASESTVPHGQRALEARVCARIARRSVRGVQAGGAHLESRVLLDDLGADAALLRRADLAVAADVLLPGEFAKHSRGARRTQAPK